MAFVGNLKKNTPPPPPTRNALGTALSVSYTSLQYNRAIYFIREKIRRDLHKTRD